jgi:DnaJ-related protein SCJ1
MVKKKILCDHCRGSGAASDGDIHSCTACGGHGVKLVKQQVWVSEKTWETCHSFCSQIFPGMFAQTQVTCQDCNGRGKVIKKQCPHCRGSKVLDHTASYTLEVAAGMPEGHEVVFEGEADESPDWEAGDIVLRVRSKKEKGGFRRKESSLYWKESIGVDEVSLPVAAASDNGLPRLVRPFSASSTTSLIWMGELLLSNERRSPNLVRPILPHYNGHLLNSIQGSCR